MAVDHGTKLGEGGRVNALGRGDTGVHARQLLGEREAPSCDVAVKSAVDGLLRFFAPEDDE